MAPALRISLIYAAVATLWIIGSDYLLERFAPNLASAYGLQTAKGVAFVLITGSLLLAVAHRQFARLIATREKLRESHRKFVTLVGNLPGMVYRCLNDKSWTMHYVSDAVEPLTGYTRADLLQGRITYEQIIHPDDRKQVREKITRAMANRQPFVLEYRIRRADDHVRWVWEQGCAMYDGVGKVLALEGFILDITDRRNAMALTAERQVVSEQARATQRTLLMVGQRMRDPLANMRALAEVLESPTMPDGKERTRIATSLSDDIADLADTVNDMIESARLGSGDDTWHWESLDLAAVCREAMDIIRPTVHASRVRLDMTLDTPKLPMNGDAEAVRRLVIHLLTNAARHTPHGFIHLSLRSQRVGADRFVSLLVEDSGLGIAPDAADRLCAMPDGQSAGDGDFTFTQGLGLTICRQIVAAHQGNIRVRSRRGEGTAVHVMLRADLRGPVAADEPAPITCSINTAA